MPTPTPWSPWLLVGSVIALSCRPAATDPGRLRIRVAPTPATVGVARIIVQLPDGLGPILEVRVEGRPSGVPEGVALPAELSGPNAYAVPAFPFPETGDWRLVAWVKTTGGRTLKDSADIRVVGGR